LSAARSTTRTSALLHALAAHLTALLNKCFHLRAFVWVKFAVVIGVEALHHALAALCSLSIIATAIAETMAPFTIAELSDTKTSTRSACTTLPT
jgi:hypothetical protein